MRGLLGCGFDMTLEWQASKLMHDFSSRQTMECEHEKQRNKAPCTTRSSSATLTQKWQRPTVPTPALHRFQWSRIIQHSTSTYPFFFREVVFELTRDGRLRRRRLTRGLWLAVRRDRRGARFWRSGGETNTTHQLRTKGSSSHVLASTANTHKRMRTHYIHMIECSMFFLLHKSSITSNQPASGVRYALFTCCFYTENESNDIRALPPSKNRGDFFL